MPAQDRRASPRRSFRLPIRLRCLDVDGEILGYTENVSSSGAFIASPKRLPVGHPVSLILIIPGVIPQVGYNELRCVGRVVHEYEPAIGPLGYGIEITRIASGLIPAILDLNQVEVPRGCEVER